MPLRIVFHGDIAKQFSAGFANVLNTDAEIIVLPEVLSSEKDKHIYSSADIIIGFRFNSKFPQPNHLKLFQVPGAGLDAIDLNALPPSAIVCNTFGHEQAIAEYVMAAMLMHQIPFAAADKELRKGNWSHRNMTREELAGKTIGLIGYGHIGKAIATRAKAFEMTVHVANRSAIEPSPIVDKTFKLNNLTGFWSTADFFVVCIGLAKETTGLVNAEAFDAMPMSSVIINVGRGPIIDEAALYDALKNRRIAGAIIDTWYNYPTTAKPNVLPSNLPFHELSNVIMTPHLSGWTTGTLRRRQIAMAENIRRLMEGKELENVVRRGK